MISHLATAQALLDVLPDPAAMAPLADINQPNASQPPGTESIQKILRWAVWIVMFLAVIGIFITAGAMALGAARGQGTDHMGRLGWVFGGMALALGAAGIVNAIM